MSENKLSQAIRFATEKHEGQKRKGTDLPYILHPLEALQILYSMGADTNLMIAGVLHDTVEDTDTTLDEIREAFGEDVAALVASNSEDKSKTWQERKEHTITELKNADVRIKMLIMADKVSNLRSIVRDYQRLGDRLWSRFNAPKEKQAWYYNGITDALFEMQGIPDCKDIYWEMNGLFKDAFVTFYFHKKRKTIYQACVTGSVYCFDYENPEWKEIPGNIFAETIVGETETISRQDGELLEDIWHREYWEKHEKDLKNHTYPVFNSEKRRVILRIKDEMLSLNCYDSEEDYEFSYFLNREDTKKLLIRLRIEFGISKKLSDIFAEMFGNDDRGQSFKRCCDSYGIVLNLTGSIQFLKQLPYENLTFLSFAEGGAMGSPGEVILVFSDMENEEWCRFNACSLEADEFSEFLNYVPPLKKLLESHVAGSPAQCRRLNDERITKNWNYVDLGAGNHLLVHVDLFSEFQKKVDRLEVKSPCFIYQNWRSFATEILESKHYHCG